MTLTFFIIFSSLFLLFVLVIFINSNSLILSNGYGQREPLDDRSPSFLEAYWTNKPTTTLSQSQVPDNPIKVEVGPGEGPSTLAVVLVNTGRSEITGITGDLTLPEGFKAIRGENDVKS